MVSFFLLSLHHPLVSNLVYFLLMLYLKQLNPSINWGPEDQKGLSAAVAIAAKNFFAQHAGEETLIKLPNDIYWRDRKYH